MERKAQVVASMTEVAEVTVRVDPAALRVEEVVNENEIVVQAENARARNIANIGTVDQELAKVAEKRGNLGDLTEIKAVPHESLWALLQQVVETLFKVVKDGTEVMVKAAEVVKIGEAAVEEAVVEGNAMEACGRKIAAMGERIVDAREEAKKGSETYRVNVRRGPDDERHKLNEARESACFEYERTKRDRREATRKGGREHEFDHGYTITIRPAEEDFGHDQASSLIRYERMDNRRVAFPGRLSGLL